MNGPLDTFIAKMNSVRKFGKRRATDHVMELSSKLEEEDLEVKNTVPDAATKITEVGGCRGSQTNHCPEEKLLTS